MVSINDVKFAMRKKKEQQIKCYLQVLNICHHKIEKYVSYQKSFCMFDVPEFVSGYPLVDVIECIEFVSKQLMQDGFEVMYIFPKFLKISWNVQTEESPLPRVDPNVRTITHTVEKGNKCFIKPISDLKPSGNFVLNIAFNSSSKM